MNYILTYTSFTSLYSLRIAINFSYQDPIPHTAFSTSAKLHCAQLASSWILQNTLSSWLQSH